MPHPKNKVVTDDYRTNSNFFESDLTLQSYLERHLSEKIRQYLEPYRQRLGERAATQMDELSLKADKYSLVLKKRTKLGQDIDKVEFHPVYWELIYAQLKKSVEMNTD